MPAVGLPSLEANWSRPPPGYVGTSHGAGNRLSDLFHTAWGDARRLILEPPSESVAMHELARVSRHHLREVSPHHDDGYHPDCGAGAGSDGFVTSRARRLTWA